MMSSAPNPDAEIAALRAALAEERAARTRAEAEIEHLKLLIAKLRRERYGQSSERGRHLLDQLELQLEELETAAGENASQGEADDGGTTVPVLARKKTVTGRIWTYVRDDRPFGGSDPPAALFHYSRDRSGKHPRGHLAEWSGILQADAYAGFNALYVKGRVPAPLTEASCWAHGGAKFFELADLAKAMRAPMAIEAVRRIDEIFAIERELNGEPAERRRIVRQARVRPLVEGLERWMRVERSKLSSGSAVAKAMDYMVKRWTTFSAFLDDGRICLTNNAAERALRGIAVGRRNWTFAGSDRGADRAAAAYTLIETARLNDVDPRAWLADVLARINDHPAKAIDDLLPWNWKAGNQVDIAA